MSQIILLKPEEFEFIKSKLNSIEQALSNAKDKVESKWLSAKETITILGIGETTLWSYRKQGKIKANKIDRKLYFLKEDVDRLISSSG